MKGLGHPPVPQPAGPPGVDQGSGMCIVMGTESKRVCRREGSSGQGSRDCFGRGWAGCLDGVGRLLAWDAHRCP